MAKGALEDSSLIFQKAKFLGAVFGAAGTLFSYYASKMEAEAQGAKGHETLSTLHYYSATSSALGGAFSFVSSIGYCKPLFEKAAARYGQNAIMRGAATRAAVWAAGRGFAYRAIFTGASMAFTMVGLAINLGIWWYSDKELAVWIEGCAFGKIQKKTGPRKCRSKN